MMLDLLREISVLAPADVLLTAFNLDGDMIDLRGRPRISTPSIRSRRPLQTRNISKR